MERNNCVICNNNNFENIASFSEFPIMAISNDFEKYQYYDFTIICCNNCGCVQLKNLVEPSILYSDVYMNSTFSPTWSDHHINFSNFITSNTTEIDFLEIGANKGDLYKNMIKTQEIKYTVLDMYKHADLPSDIEYIEGNCETFNFNGINNVILSHVFEHLYSPREFINNLKKAGVSNVFISIPNFDTLLIAKSFQILHSQHTFFLGFEYIKHLFSLYNYRLETYTNYNGNFKSSFFKFILDNNFNSTSLTMTNKSYNIQLFKNIYIDDVLKLNSIEIPQKCYITPSGIYGQFIYYNLKNKNNIIGFLDNNIQRKNNLLYGTNINTFYPPETDLTNVSVIVCDCPYKEEIVLTLKNICSSVHLIYT